jgi:hypothetical protein
MNTSSSIFQQPKTASSHSSASSPSNVGGNRQGHVYFPIEGEFVARYAGNVASDTFSHGGRAAKKK